MTLAASPHGSTDHGPGAPGPDTPGSPDPASGDHGHAAPPRLGTLEARVMDLVWDQPGLTVRDVIDAHSGRPAYTTIATVLTNLERKELVRRSRSGRYTVYHPLITREEHAATAMTSALEASRDHAASILHFVQSMPDDDRALLREYLAEHPAQDADQSTLGAGKAAGEG